MTEKNPTEMAWPHPNQILLVRLLCRPLDPFPIVHPRSANLL